VLEINSLLLYSAYFWFVLCISVCFLDGGMNESGSANCLFQAFVEYLVGMKLTAVTRTEGMSISALHQSSGNSSILHNIFNSLKCTHISCIS
jgi:hypothetical protein